MLRARELGISTQSFPNASIMSAIGATGLQLYNFGQTVSMVFFTDGWRPSSVYDRMRENAGLGLHTLVLLDIKVKEQSLEDLARGRRVFQPPRYMAVAQCAAQMLELERDRGRGVCRPEALAVGAARVGSTDQRFVCGTLQQLATVDLGPPLHSLVLLGTRTHDLERTFLRHYALDPSIFDDVWARDYHGKQDQGRQAQDELEN